MLRELCDGALAEVIHECELRRSVPGYSNALTLLFGEKGRREERRHQLLVRLAVATLIAAIASTAIGIAALA